MTVMSIPEVSEQANRNQQAAVSANGAAEHKRINITLSKSAYDDLTAEARQARVSMTELMRMGFALAKAAIEARRRGEKLAVIDKTGKVLKEILIAQ